MLIYRSIQIQNVLPELDGGRYPIKREVGDGLEVCADIIKEGHDVLSAVVRYREIAAPEWVEARMSLAGNDLWKAHVPLSRNTRYVYTVRAWTNTYETWRNNIERSLAAGHDGALELLEGRSLIVECLARVSGDRDRHTLIDVLHRFDTAATGVDKSALLLGSELRRVMNDYGDRADASDYVRELEVVVDRPCARYAAWYEMFHRSQGTRPGVSATFADCEARLDEIAALGFDVIYLVPIHPIGITHRKGPNNSISAGPGDPGSPYAIGNRSGGHTAVHPDLGTLDDLQRFVRRAGELDMEVALDIALQCSPDHPYLERHPEWFVRRIDGSIRCIENPPKRYQDIVSVDFGGPYREAIWHEWRNVVLFWVEQGIKIFRVDNPHTKPIPFWEWLIRDIQLAHPEVVFLAEAFTRPKLLKALAKAGFSQSYTYFTWRNFKQELIDYFSDLTQGEEREYLRPNLFTNTPDILPEFLQTGGRPAFQIRLVLAATLSSLYGIYNGFELCESQAIAASEEYLNSEKYQYKVWDWDRPGNIKDYIAKVNRIRRDNLALHQWKNLRFHASDSDHVLFYSKIASDADNAVLIAVNLDPFETHQATLTLPLAELGLADDKAFQVEELLNLKKNLWRGARHRVTLDPQCAPAMIFRITSWAYRDYVDTCF